MAKAISSRLHHNVKDLSGKRFGFLVAISYVGNKRWLCKCDCGTEKTILSANLCTGTTRSCGCNRRKAAGEKHVTHGMSDSPEYKLWVNMKHRCLNQNAANYKQYGGAGVTVCKEWIESFDVFYADMGPRPSPRHQLDRFPNQKGNYEPGNVRWATGTQQHRNKSSNKKLTFCGKTQLLTEWSKETGIGAETIAARLKRGWSIERALTTRV